MVVELASAMVQQTRLGACRHTRFLSWGGLPPCPYISAPQRCPSVQTSLLCQASAILHSPGSRLRWSFNGQKYSVTGLNKCIEFQ